MSLGPEKIILILVVALIVFGPQRLPEIARQVGAALRELRRMQDTVRGELEQVLHPDYTPPSPGANEVAASSSGAPAAPAELSSQDTDHAALPPGALYEPHGNGTGSANGSAPANGAGDYPAEDISDDGFAGPRSFS